MKDVLRALKIGDKIELAINDVGSYVGEVIIVTGNDELMLIGMKDIHLVNTCYPDTTVDVRSMDVFDTTEIADIKIITDEEYKTIVNNLTN